MFKLVLKCNFVEISWVFNESKVRRKKKYNLPKCPNPLVFHHINSNRIKVPLVRPQNWVYIWWKMREKITNLSKVHKGKPQIDALLNLFRIFFFTQLFSFILLSLIKTFPVMVRTRNKSNEKLLHTFSIYLIFLTTIIITLPQLVLTHLLAKYGTEALSLMSPFIFSLTFCSCEWVCVCLCGR